MTELIRYEAARAALAECKRVDEVKDIRDQWEAMRLYQRIAGNHELEADAAELRERAERRLGELIIAAKAAGQVSRGQPKKNSADPEEFSRVKLADAGISHKLSARTQKKASISERAYEAMIARMREDIISGKRTADVLKGSAQAEQQQHRRSLEEALSDESERLTSHRKYPCIYADPATRFRAGIGNRSIENHYPTMTTEEICGLPVPACCLPNCRLYIWTTVPQLVNTIARIIPAWGFEYSSHCVWDKTDEDHKNEVGTGLVFRNQHELLIYATKGRPAGPAFKPRSIHRERKREHSRKPDYYREMIHRMTGGDIVDGQWSGGLSVLELFARVDEDHPLPPRWGCWGNQAITHADDGTPCDPATGELHAIEAKDRAVTIQGQEPADDGGEHSADDDLVIPALLIRKPKPSETRDVA